jgi:DNA-binding MarR family transcriptional regulator
LTGIAKKADQLPPTSHSYDSLTQHVDRLQAELDGLRSIATSFDPSRPPRKVTAVWIRAILKARRRRERLLGSAIFADPAWDILLELYAIELEKRQATTTEVCKASAVPGTTGLRWIGELDEAGLIIRTSDKVDRRRVFVRLSPRGLAAMKEYFHDGLANGAGL